MKAKFIILMLLFSVFGTFDSGAQIRSVLRDRAREALRSQEEKELEKIEQEREERKEQEQDKPRQPSAFERRMEERMKKAMGFADLNYETRYIFNSSMSMDVENYDAGSDETSRVLYTTFFNDDNNSFAMRFRSRNADTGKDEDVLMVLI
jgi:hypothetical protein